MYKIDCNNKFRARWTKKLMNDGHKVLGEYYLSLWLLWYEKHAYLIFGKVLHIHINHLRFYPLFQTDKFKQTMAFSLLINHYFFSKFIVAVNFVHHNENSYQKLLLFYFCLLRRWSMLNRSMWHDCNLYLPQWVTILFLYTNCHTHLN
jgi:hypothetical protein